ncbi:hypothetical protein LWM68_02130 [Niabella sp. W65]|nr:hypothetical protein [Niabella sp. W65]MCH7361686.1 hypothetical protein [Niabella sp. W65]ULT45461.1 hypothetical protein KRR40_20645 [Niabella sp. I65]
MIGKGNDLTIEAENPHEVFAAIEQPPVIVADTHKPLPCTKQDDSGSVHRHY